MRRMWRGRERRKSVIRRGGGGGRRGREGEIVVSDDVPSKRREAPLKRIREGVNRVRSSNRRGGEEPLLLIPPLIANHCHYIGEFMSPALLALTPPVFRLPFTLIHSRENHTDHRGSEEVGRSRPVGCRRGRRAAVSLEGRGDFVRVIG